MVLLDGAAPPSDAYKATVIAGILKEHEDTFIGATLIVEKV
jgi:hypothetical protein